MKITSFALGLLIISGSLFAQQKKKTAPATNASTVIASPSNSAAPTRTLIERIEAQPSKISIAYERWKLANGLTVLLHEDHSDPVVNVMVTYKVGSNRESIGKSGFAHFFEHMMFQGSKHVGDEEHFKLVSNAGGTMNGFTQRDKTVYFETLPSNYLEMALWLESDRMGFLLDSLTSKKFENQRDAVKNEKSQNVENQPYAMAFVEEINKTLYPNAHPYSWPVIGYVDDLNKANLTDVKNFFLRWYGPNNAILTVSGDFQGTQALDWIEKYFGSLKPCPEVKKLRTPAVTIASDKYTAYKDRTYFPLNLRVYPTVSHYHKDEPALDLLSTMMGGGNNSVFYKNFVKSKLAVQAGVSHQSEDLSGEFQIQIFAYPPEDFDLEKLFSELDNKVKAAIDEFALSGITDEALAIAKGQIESQIYSGVNSVFGKASIISEWERLLSKSFYISEELDRYTKVTKEDIERVFKKYIKGSGAAVLNTYPIMDTKDSVKSINPYAALPYEENPEYKGLSYQPIPDAFNRALRPVAGSAVTVKTPVYFQQKLKNGVPVIGTVSKETPEVNVFITLEGGSLFIQDKLKKLGIPEMTAAMLNEGTEHFTTEQISAALDKMGSSISFSSDRLSTSIMIRSLNNNLDATLKLLDEKLFHPGFKEEDFKLAKKQYRASIKDEETSADQIADKLFDYAMYGDNIMGLRPSTKTVDAIELSDLKSYYNSYYAPDFMRIVVVGDIEEQDILNKLSFLGNWKSKGLKLPDVPAAKPTANQQFLIGNKTLASSSVIKMGYPSLKFDATGDFYKNRIANFIFGGNFNSRLNLNLREQKGYTYGIRSSFEGDAYNGRFVLSSSVKRSATALSLAEIFKELNRYVKDGISDEELNFTKSSLLNQEALKYEAPMQKASFLYNIQRFNLPSDFTRKQNEILNAMTRNDVNAQISKSFLPALLTTVVVGDRYIIESQIEKAKEGQQKELLNNVKFKKISID